MVSRLLAAQGPFCDHARRDSANCLLTVPVSWMDDPVTFLGCARLAIGLLPRRSIAMAKTMGMLDVGCFIAATVRSMMMMMIHSDHHADEGGGIIGSAVGASLVPTNGRTPAARAGSSRVKSCQGRGTNKRKVRGPSTR